MRLPYENSSGQFVIHAHKSRKFHWDLRLEVPAEENDFEQMDILSYKKIGIAVSRRDTVMWSFAVPKAKFPEKGEKLLLIETEPHPVEYNSFEGIIPEKIYGAGEVRIYDKGVVKWLEVNLSKKKIRFELLGEKINARFSIIKYGKEDKKWLWLREEQVS